MNKIIRDYCIVPGLCLMVCLSSILSAEDSVFPAKITEAVSEGKVIIDTRLRYEYADQSGRDESNAITLRTRLGYETAELYGFKLLGEFEGTAALNSENDYNPYPQAGKTVIADPENAELNRLQLSWSGYDSAIIAGRQRIILDNARFVGNVGWRQNEQTFDALVLSNSSIEKLTLIYGYIDQINRIFGVDAPVGALRRLHSKAHAFNVSYELCELATITAYDYYLDVDNAAAASSNTYGLHLKGKYSLNKDVDLDYYAELAQQEDAANSPLSYDATYYHLKLGATYDRFDAGIGYEVLGSDNGSAFQTPLATAHTFNGWADKFVTTPAFGLEDIYVWVGAKLTDAIKAKLIYHDFESDTGNVDLGSEFDVALYYTIDDNWAVSGKCAAYSQGSSTTAQTDTTKCSLQVDFKY